jgi:hypothetical protein
MKTLAQLNQYSTSSVVFTDETLGAGQVLANRYQINGLLDTAVPVLENIEKLCNAAGSWLSYDIHEGKWGVVINQSGTSIVSFNDSNIIGNITVSGTGLQDLYNSVKVQFPHRELRDSADFITIEIPDGDRNPNEFDNTLNISYDVINEPVQADLLGFIELKQSRVDLVIKFAVDFSYINLKAGDLIDVTDSRFAFSNKLFRIVTITEVQDDEGPLLMEIIALEYDANVYSTADLFRYTRTDENGIVTIGSIGVPGTPQVTKYEVDARPRVIIESTAPTGVVEGLEYWLTNDVSEIQDDNRSYTLIATKRPIGGGIYNSGDTVSLDYDQLGTSNFYVKTRGFNATTVGPYSNPSGLAIFTATQLTDAIGPNTKALDALGTIGTLLGVYSLLKGVDELYQKVANTGSLFTKIFETLKDATGIDLIGPEAVPPGPPITIRDEGTLIASTATEINFVGDGVTASVTSGTLITVSIDTGGSTPGAGGGVSAGGIVSNSRIYKRQRIPVAYTTASSLSCVYTCGKFMVSTLDDTFNIGKDYLRPRIVSPGTFEMYLDVTTFNPSVYYSICSTATSGVQLVNQNWGDWIKVNFDGSKTWSYVGLGESTEDDFLLPGCNFGQSTPSPRQYRLTINLSENQIFAFGVGSLTAATVTAVRRTIIEDDIVSTSTQRINVVGSTSTNFTSYIGTTATDSCIQADISIQRIS